jgi:hypothetical protein
MLFMWSSISLVLADSFVVRVAIDDRVFKRLDKPVVVIEGLETDLLDDGTVPGDAAGDQIFVGQTNIQHQQSILLQIRNVNGESIGQVEVSVPNSSSFTYQLKTSKQGVVLDLNAPNMPIREAEVTQLFIQGTERSTSSLSEGQSEIMIQIDATDRTLKEPMVTLNDRPEWTMLTDDGTVEGDLPDDDVYTGIISLPSRESLGFQVTDSGQILGELEALLPSAQGVLISLKYDQFGLSGMVGDGSSETGTMVVQATPKGEQIASTSDTDKIALTVHMDDRLLQRLQIPSVTFVAQESAGVNFRDDGSNGDEEAEDHVWMAKTVLEREEFVQLKVLDIELEQGQLTVFLPSTSEAVVWLRSTETGIKLVTEPTQASSTSMSTSVDSVGGSSDRLAHVLWVMLALFAIAFTYVRTIVQQQWSAEIQPVLTEMKNFLTVQASSKSSTSSTSSTLSISTERSNTEARSEYQNEEVAQGTQGSQGIYEQQEDKEDQEAQEEQGAFIPSDVTKSGDKS